MGHYYSYNIYNNRCIMYNDEIVKEIDINKIDKINSYILIYNKL